MRFLGSSSSGSTSGIFSKSQAICGVENLSRLTWRSRRSFSAGVQRSDAGGMMSQESSMSRASVLESSWPVAKRWPISSSLSSNPSGLKR